MRELDESVARAVGSAPVAYQPVSGGYSTADRYRVRLADGRTVFVKSATVEEAPHMAEWLRREYQVYAHLTGSFIPRLEGFADDGVRVLLALEDLGAADWSPGWDAARLAALRNALDELATSQPPPNTQPWRETFPFLAGRWRELAEDPEPFLATGLRDRAWLERNLETIVAAADAAPVDGNRLCHLDVRSDNLCFRDGRVVLVDWNWLSFAGRHVDLSAWAPSAHLEGAPPPWELLPGQGQLAAFVAGVWAVVAGLPPPETAPTVRTLQRAQLAVALDWLDRDLL